MSVPDVDDASSDPGRPAPLPALAGFWAVFVALYTLRGLVLWGPREVTAFPRRLVVAAVGVALAWLIRRALVRLRPASNGAAAGWTLAFSLPAGAAFAAANVLVFNVIAPDAAETCSTGRACDAAALFAAVSDQAINWAFVFAAWCLLLLVGDAAAARNAADRRAAAHREAARVAELKALRYQINPHFLFNMLNTLSSLVLKRAWPDAELLIADLARHFRYSLAADPMAEVRLDDEAAMQAGYLALEQRRFGRRLQVRMDIDPAVAAVPVPALVLQPLVENAVKFAVACSRAPVTITLRARAAAGALVVVVEDDGRPQSPSDEPTPAGLGVGLRNVAERLAARYGPAATCHAAPRPEGGFRVELQLPLASAR
jgi:hypothetical protein